MPRFVKIIFIVLFILLFTFFLLTTLGYQWLNRSLPVAHGEKAILGLADSVNVYRDGYHVPHILANTDNDLWFMQGYVVSQDRFFQMDCWRHMFQGKLHELLGMGAEKTDNLMTDLELKDVVDAMLSKLTLYNRAIYESYSRGVNAYLDQYQNRLPIEYRLLNHKPVKWQVEDCLTVFLGYAFLMELDGCGDLIIQAMVDKVGLQQVQQLFPEIIIKSTILKDKARATAFLTRWHKARDEGYLPQFFSGGQVWVAPDTLSVSGKPLFALNLTGSYQLPTPFYEIHLHAPSVEVAGFSLPGFPALLFGYNSVLTWGGNLPENQKVLPSGRDSHISMNSLNDPGEIFFKIIQAKNAAQGISILENLSMPKFHWICADTSGNIVYGNHYLASLKSNRISLWIDQRIQTLIREHAPVSMMGCQQIQMDNRSVLAEQLLPELLPFISGDPKFQEWTDRFHRWDKNMRIGDAEAVVFETWIRKIAEFIFIDELGPSLFQYFLTSPQIWQSALVECIQKSNDWVDNRQSPNLESIDKIIRFGLQDALTDIEKKQGKQVSKWSWGKSHSFMYRHILSEHEAFKMSRSLGVEQPIVLGPYAMEGCYSSIIGNDVYQTDSCFASGTVARMIVDLSHPDNTLSILSTGQSGQMVDTHYQDQIPLFTRGYYHPNLFEEDKIKQAGWQCYKVFPGYAK